MLTVLVYDWDDEGKPLTTCDTCPQTPKIKALLGCGYSKDYKGRATQGRIKTCAGWYRQQPAYSYFDKLVRLYGESKPSLDNNNVLIELAYYYSLLSNEKRYNELSQQKKSNEV